MKKCVKCGTINELDANFCTSCATKFKKSKNIKTVKEKFITNTTVHLAEGEINVKSYNFINFSDSFIAAIFRLNGRGTISVTNKRIVYLAERYSGRGKSFSELSLETVTGFKSNRGRNINIILFLLYVIWVSLVSIGLVEAISEGTLFGIVSSILVILVLKGVFNFLFPNMYNLTFFTSGCQESPVSINNTSIMALLRLGASEFNLGRIYTTKENEVMIAEIGALVMDIKSMGDLGIKKWIGEEEEEEQVLNTTKVEETTAESGEFF